MQFTLKKEISGGRFFVKITLTEWTDQDKSRASKFGTPTLVVRLSNGNTGKVSVLTVGAISAYGFYTQDEADQYSDNIKIQVAELKKEWNSLEDSWSNEEIL